jgi:chromosome segregation ATPase
MRNEDELKTLGSDIKEAEDRTAKAKADFDRLTARLAEANEGLAALESERATLQEALAQGDETARKRLAGLQKEMSEAGELVAGLASLTAKAERSWRESGQQLGELTARKAEIEAEIARDERRGAFTEKLTRTLELHTALCKALGEQVDAAVVLEEARDVEWLRSQVSAKFIWRAGGPSNPLTRLQLAGWKDAGRRDLGFHDVVAIPMRRPPEGR